VLARIIVEAKAGLKYMPHFAAGTRSVPEGTDDLTS
jgi:hypothetical protein